MINTDYQESATTAADAVGDHPSPQSAASDNARASDCFIKSEYLTIDITNGKKTTLEELRQRFPRINIFKLPHLVLFGNHISLYRLDRKLGVTK